MRMYVLVEKLKSLNVKNMKIIKCLLYQVTLATLLSSPVLLGRVYFIL